MLIPLKIGTLYAFTINYNLTFNRVQKGSGATSLFEVAAAERRFYSFFNCILSSVVHPLKESSKNHHSVKAHTEIDL